MTDDQAGEVVTASVFDPVDPTVGRYGLVLATEHPEFDEWVREQAARFHPTTGVQWPYRGVWTTAALGDVPVHLFAPHESMGWLTEPDGGGFVQRVAAEPEPPDVDGPVLSAVKTDLEQIDVDKVPGGHTYRALALWLAGVIDKRGSDDGPSTTAKLADQLRATMAALTRRGGDDGDDFREFTESLSVPVVG